ncbi:hypothetical protein M378DRAFT_19000 [Amanita muscaria Koide BX008]|uniref:Uncharacterized protein n=1 Tax=Amanita muscaria (strain Koide BX008) TaxID=946122 RepID=A0A0C2WE58_AMAMK|nr:hypothetical protein M378DRAFT_19000 [Amanita muscaria Koide BX008]
MSFLPRLPPCANTHDFVNTTAQASKRKKRKTQVVLQTFLLQVFPSIQTYTQVLRSERPSWGFGQSRVERPCVMLSNFSGDVEVGGIGGRDWRLSVSSTPSVPKVERKQSVG